MEMKDGLALLVSSWREWARIGFMTPGRESARTVAVSRTVPSVLVVTACLLASTMISAVPAAADPNAAPKKCTVLTATIHQGIEWIVAYADADCSQIPGAAVDHIKIELQRHYILFGHNMPGWTTVETGTGIHDGQPNDETTASHRCPSPDDHFAPPTNDWKGIWRALVTATGNKNTVTRASRSITITKCGVRQ